MRIRYNCVLLVLFFTQYEHSSIGYNHIVNQDVIFEFYGL